MTSYLGNYLLEIHMHYACSKLSMKFTVLEKKVLNLELATVHEN